VQELVGRIEDRRVITYGENPQSDVRLLDVDLAGGVTKFNVLLRDRVTSNATYLQNLILPMPGRHNALNATAAIAVAHQLGMSHEQIRNALANFGGVKRRFTLVGEWNGARFFDDYGHHPVEIAAVLSAARAATRAQVIAIVQPHRYTRLQSLFDQFATCFNDADAVIVADVYAAGEKPIAGADRDHLVGAIKAHGHRNAMALEHPDHLAVTLRPIIKPGDYVICLGAGNITNWAYALPGQLAALDRA
jgi:UDP-N-acetylmuramate--alanine ligase